jgi:hypothetical protein
MFHAGHANTGQMKLFCKGQPSTAVSVLLLAALTLACLLPFLNKAVHMDDPLFIWTARQVRSHPLDFYGFLVDWEKRELPMAIVMQNPPLAGYYLAAVGSLLGWSESALHFGFLLPALALVIGAFFLARSFCAHPVAAALGTLAAPVFLLSSTSLMCDTMMAALWVWAMYFWLEGLRLQSAPRLFLAALLIAAGSLTKYFGACLVPLLFVYSVMRQRRLGVWLAYLCLPVMVLAGYQVLTARLYGRGLLTNAAVYASVTPGMGGLTAQFLAALAFTGGGVFIALAAAPLLWGRKGLALCGVGALALACLMFGMKQVGKFSVMDAGHVKWLELAQIAVFACGGVSVLILAAADVWTRRDPASVLLLLWTGGTFVFAWAVNWTVSGRNFLPLVPAVSCLVVRRLESRASAANPEDFRLLWRSLGISLAVALAVAWGDCKLADSARTAAVSLQEQFGPASSGVQFEGHWGFQYYMELLGAKAVSSERLNLASNQVVFVPLNNSQIFTLPDDRVETLARCHFPAAGFVALMSAPLGAGYYSDRWGPAPFVFGPAPDEDYLVVRVK